MPLLLFAEWLFVLVTEKMMLVASEWLVRLTWLLFCSLAMTSYTSLSSI